MLQVLYKCTIAMTKTSILLLYVRIFHNVAKFRRICHCLLGYIIAYAIASILATIFQCSPIKRTFNHKLPGTCINLTAFWYANAISSILTDIVVLLLPMPLLKRLHLPRRQKYGLMGVFALGGLYVSLPSLMLPPCLTPLKCLHHVNFAYDNTRSCIEVG